jgi:competence ComEA-like helix-hairpin-helix protein
MQRTKTTGDQKIRSYSFFALGVGACALVTSTLITAAPVARTPTQEPSTNASATDDPAAGLFVQMCVKCHDAARITAMRRTGTEWEEVIKKMIEKGAAGTEKDFENVYGYLLRNFGKLYINVATADEIAMIVGLSEKDTQGIVAYREANGPFADFEAVKKVPGIDLKKLDEHKDAVAF